MPFSLPGVDDALPPVSLALLALLALVLPARWARPVAALFLLPLVLLSIPLVGQLLLRSLDLPEIAVPASATLNPQAIVILSADVERTATPGLAEIGPLTLERERSGAALQRRTSLPVLVTGGLVTAPPPVGAMMAASLPADFGVPVRWAETRSATTWENAQFSAPLLRAAGIDTVYLVTHAWHMRRSLLAFQKAGISALPAPVRGDPEPKWVVEELYPRASAWQRSYYALHEWVGLLYYRWRS